MRIVFVLIPGNGTWKCSDVQVRFARVITCKAKTMTTTKTKKKKKEDLAYDQKKVKKEKTD